MLARDVGAVQVLLFKKWTVVGSGRAMVLVHPALDARQWDTLLNRVLLTLSGWNVHVW